MNNLSLLIANVEIARRVTDAGRRRRARDCRAGRRPSTAVLPRRSVQL